jgi:hypothetical protein
MAASWTIFPNHTPLSTRNNCLATGRPNAVSKQLQCFVGLQQFVAQAQLQEAVKVEGAAKAEPTPGSLSKGQDTIYVGKGQFIQVLLPLRVYAFFVHKATAQQCETVGS